MNIDDIQARLEELATELWTPDHEARELRDQIAATYRRTRGGIFAIDLEDAAGIDERNRLRAVLDENCHRYGKMRAERSRLQSELRRLTRGDESPAKPRRRAA
jgi:hypothetical protein